ncbi:MAG: tyrosine-type recombinase/integrase [Holosporales bacterium]|jgi:integrase/recombinase XerC|nr:tyrosine-type recombinase/integrase [Holosporales bacterium]
MITADIQRLLEEWKKDLVYGRGMSIHTGESYVADLNLLLGFLLDYKSDAIGLNDVLMVGKRDIRSWFLSRCNEDVSAKSLSRSLSALKNFLKYCMEKGLIQDSEILDMRPPRIHKSLPRPIAAESINDILESVYECKKTDWIIMRDIALLALIYSVGLRISEAINIKRDEFLNSSGFLRINGKGGKTRTIPLIADIHNLIRKYLGVCIYQQAEYLFVNRFGAKLSASATQKLLKNLRRKLGLAETVTPHALRHSCATHLMESSGDLRSIQELLGHSSISSTQIYADIAKKYITDVYDKCHPLSGQNSKKEE